MAAHVYRHRQTGHVGGGGLDGQSQAGGLTAEALGADAQRVDLCQQFLLQTGVKGVGIGLVDGPEPGVFRQLGHLVKGTADADAQHNGGTGVGAGQTHRLKNEVFHALHPVGGLEHPQAAHIL